MNRILRMVLKNAFFVPGAYAKLCRYAKHPERYEETQMYGHIRSFMQRAVAAGNVELQVHGKENVPAENGFLLCGNHQGIFDIVALVADFEGPLAAVFKKELANVPFIKQLIACSNSFSMDREDVRQSLTVIQAVTAELKKGRSYLIFPEGTRSKLGNKMLPFHGGSFRCAVKAKCPVVPMALIDSFKVLDQKGSKPVTVQIHYLPPIQYEEYQGMKAAQLAELVQSRIQACLDAHADTSISVDKEK